MHQTKLNMIHKPLRITLLALFSVIFFSACNSGETASERPIHLLQDSTSFSNNAQTDVADEMQEIDEPTPDAPQQEASRKPAPAPKKAPAKSPVADQNVEVQQPAASTPEVESAPQEQSAAQPTVTEKKGMSKSAQGAIIGGAAGAVGGAIISKKKGVGAVVGAAAGAAAGAVIGKQKEKKENAKKQEEGTTEQP